MHGRLAPLPPPRAGGRRRRLQSGLVLWESSVETESVPVVGPLVPSGERWALPRPRCWLEPGRFFKNTIVQTEMIKTESTLRKFTDLSARPGTRQTTRGGPVPWVVAACNPVLCLLVTWLVPSRVCRQVKAGLSFDGLLVVINGCLVVHCCSVCVCVCVLV